MNNTPIPAETSIVSVKLKVADLSRSLDFYVDRVGFKSNSRWDNTISLSANGMPPYCFSLVEIRGAEPKPPRTTGLYHAAIRLPSRTDLANTVKRLLSVEWPFLNAADHGVSEAVYTADPDGNGLEFYADRPRSRWRRSGRYYRMVTEPLDLTDLLDACNDGRSQEIPGGTDIGHIHLQVADLEAARHFYHNLLGFDITQADFPGALFLSAGGYHHHIGVNTWAGNGAGPAPENAVGLASFAVRIPSGKAYQAVRARLESSGVPVTEVRKNGIFAALLVKDPSGNLVELLL